jgi:3-deoxy-D-manno-octulosonic-acid transferase
LNSVSWPLAYRAATAAATPLVRFYLHARIRRGKEDPERIAERYGIAGTPRPRGKLIWIHAASVGEAMSVLALIDRLLAQHPAVEILLTTGTAASARLLAGRLPSRVRHQFVPVDLPRAVDRFLDHWRPDLALWVESELWPNLVLGTRRRLVPMLLLNGRLSARSFRRWHRMPGLIRPVLQAFALCLAQDEQQAARFRALGACEAASVGDLKAAAASLAADPAGLATLQQQIGSRPVWIAASTHPGEEEIAAAAHVRVAREHPRLLTIIAPRHPPRGAAIAEMLRQQGLNIARRGCGQALAGDTEIYLADTLGELGLMFRIARIAFIGGSLVAKGGHNPLEAARLGCAVLHGGDMSNCAVIAASLDRAGAALTVGDADSLGAAVARLLDNPDERRARAKAAMRVAAAGACVLDRVLAHLAPWLDALAPFAQSPPAQSPPAQSTASQGARRTGRDMLQAAAEDARA